MSPRLRVAVIGTGSMGKNHARVYNELDSVDLVAVCDANMNTVEDISRAYGCKGYTDHMVMLRTERLDAVTIAVPTAHHYRVALDAIHQGVNVLIEKPIAASVTEGEALIAAAKEHNVKLMVGHIERFNPAILELKKRLVSGQLGHVFKIHARRIGPFPKRIRDVGVIRDLAVHDLDIMKFLTSSQVSRVYAETAQRIHTNNEDLLSGLIRFDGGTIGMLSINWLTPTKVRELTITGEKGMFIADYISQELTFYENAELTKDYTYSDILRGVSEGTMTKYFIQKREPLKNELEHFVQCVQNNLEPLVTGKDGLEAIRLAEGLIESSENGKSVFF